MSEIECTTQAESVTAAPNPITHPACKFTHTTNPPRVRILKSVDANRKSYGGFQWPESGPVSPDKWSRQPDCESGGLFGWAWGIGFGDGKEPDANGLWIVFEAHPDDVIEVTAGGKCKSVPNPEENRTPVVIFCGSLAKANQLILDGQIAWARFVSENAPASSSGVRAPASSSGDYAPASSSGFCAPASSSGDYAPASSSGFCAPASSSGFCAPASSSGVRAPAKASGERSIASATGPEPTVEAGTNGIACSTADECTWIVHEAAVFVQKWEGGHRCVTAAEISAKTGDRVTFRLGEIVKHEKAQ